jgi:flagellar biosynthetic protein FlhB
MADSQEKTEQATPKRMKEVRSKGELGKSQDVTAWVGVGAAALMIPSTIAHASDAATHQLFTVRSIISDPDPGKALQALSTASASLGETLLPMLVVVTIAVIASSAVQGGIHVTKPKVKFEHLNLLTGVKRTFGGQALWQGLKSLLKTAVVALVMYAVIQSLMPVLMSAGDLPVAALLSAAGGGVSAMIQFAVYAGLALAAADIFVVMRRNRKRTRMSKKEVMDENKNSEGDPLIKGQRKSLQMAMSRNRMIAAIGDADVVLLNPTHIAVAIKYEPGKSAPRVVAKGSGVIAARIREEAEAHKVPMVRDIPLARALHAACELGHEIPVELYGAVAQVLAFVLHLNSRGKTGRVETMSTSFLTPEGI